MNVVILLGHHYALQSKNPAVYKFSIRESWKKGGEWQSAFHHCVAFDKTAALIQEHFKKGSAIGIEGRLTQNEWEDDSGSKRKSTEVVVNRLTFLPKDLASKEDKEDPTFDWDK
jgi:single stranded DNA-binding protein